MSAAGRSSGIGAGSMLAAARLDHPGARCRRGVGDAVSVEYVSRVPRPPLDALIDDLYYLEGAPPYARLTLPPMPAALLIVNLGAPFRIRAGAGGPAGDAGAGLGPGRRCRAAGPAGHGGRTARDADAARGGADATAVL